MRENQTKRALEAGETVFGTMTVEFRAPSIAQIFVVCGFDFMLIDTEHSAYTTETVTDIIWTSKMSGITPIVRVQELQYSFISRALDSGAQGVMVPHVETPEQAQAVVHYVKFPPLGRRGLATGTSHSDFAPGNVAEFIAVANRETMVVIQVESRKAVEQVEELVSVPGVDVALMGLNDLSKSYGVVGQTDHRDVQSAIDRVIDACGKHGVVSGIHTGNLDLIERLMAKGMRFIAWSSDVGMILEGGKGALRRLRRD
ncbi:MAG: HpcH/HpaI aldolase/citrate lyase family protein [Candidatus Bipolaricaulia bacterium]